MILNSKNIQLFITDIDGVWTDGGMFYDKANNELKKFNTSDSVGVLFLRLLDIPMAIITGENTKIVKRRAEKLKIKNLFLGIKDKVAVADKLHQKYNLDWKDIAYIGDDINDIKLLQKVGLSACPKQAPEYIQNQVNWVLSKNGGEGAFREFIEKYLIEKNMLQIALDKYLKINNSLNQ